MDALFAKLRGKIDIELQFHQKAFELLGALDTLFAAAAAPAIDSVDTTGDDG